jgi:anti-anti-sigma factor
VPDSALLQCHTEHSDGGARVVLRGELDISSAHRLEDELSRVEAQPPGVLMMDLRELRFMDSTGLRMIVRADQRAREGGRRLVLVRGPERVDRVFKITKLDERLEIVDDPGALEARGVEPGEPA